MNNITARQYYIGQALPALIKKYSGLDVPLLADKCIEVSETLLRKERAIFYRTGEMFRQGDVLIAKIDAIPFAALPAPYEHNHAVLAHGEVTGHKHQLVQDEAQLFAMNDNVFLRIISPVGYVRHEEHSAIALKQGDYQVIKQREASDNDDKPKAVAD